MAVPTLIELRPLPSSRGAAQPPDGVVTVFFEDANTGRPLPHPQKGEILNTDGDRWPEEFRGRKYMVDRVEWGLAPVAAPAPHPTKIVALRLS